MYHNGPSGNGIRTENFNNIHLLKEDFGTSVDYIRWNINLRYVNRQWRQKRLYHNLTLDQNDKLRIPTYQAEIEPAIFIIHSQFETL